MSRLADAVQRALPPNPLARRLSAQSVLFAVGEGVFITGNAVFFTQVVGLSATQVGIGLSISGVVVLLLSVPAGRLVDRVGAQRSWWSGALMTAAAYLCYPLVSGFAAFVGILIVLAAVDAFGSAGRGAYTIEAFAPEERVRSQAFMRSALNIGFTLGALMGGLALATGSNQVIRFVPVFTAAVLLLNALLISRLPRVHSEVEAPVVDPAEAIVAVSGFRNRGFLVLGLCNGILSTNQVLLNVVVPLWLVERTDAPHTLLAWLFGTNTVLVVLLQVRASRGSDTVTGALRAVRRCAAAFVLSCAVIAVTHDTVGWVSIVLIWLGHVTITGAELYQSASGWGFMALLSDPARRGEYQGLWRIGFQVETVVGPALFTFLALTLGTVGWVLIAAIAVVAAAVSHPAARAAERYLDALPDTSGAVPRMGG